jgi:beta-barrel assembly-enhancing protease
MKSSLVLDPNPTVDAALQRIVDRLAPHADLRDFDLDVIDVDSAVVNAMALPGGKLFIHRGLVRILEGPDELAAVMAHEIAHVTERHGMQRIAEQVGMFALLRAYFGDAGAVIETFGGFAGDLASLGWSRDAEAEADREAVRMCAAAGIDPLALERAFARMQEATRDSVDIPKWFSSHPPTDERRDAVRAAAAERSVVDPRPIDVDWTALQAAIAD